jgi:uncharacterized protein (TIGR02118 family)
MIKRVSLVRKLPELSRQEFLSRWLGEHVEVAKGLPGLCEYTIDILQSEGSEPPYDGIATLRFDSPEAMEAAFAHPETSERLRATRAEFAQSVEVFVVEEHVVVPRSQGAARRSRTH